jgi:hypothetical protein
MLQAIGSTESQTRQETHGERKMIGPTKDSVIEWVSFESIEIVMAPLKAEPDRCARSLRSDR